MDRVIFPTKVISISQKFHSGHKAWDLNGSDRGIDVWYAPCRIKVLAIFPIETTGFYNTVLFGTCDESGNQAPVMCADGQARVLTFGCTHMDDLNKYGLQVGKIYHSGDKCYDEGTTGFSTGNHVHMDVAEGWQYRRTKESGKWYLPNLVDIEAIFYQLEGWNTIRNTNGYTFPTTNSRNVDIDPIEYDGYIIYTDNLSLRVRDEPVDGDVLVTVPQFQNLKVRYFCPGFESDEYQWAATEYNGVMGFSQLDTKGYYTLLQTNEKTHDLYLNAMSRGLYIREQIVDGKVIKNVPPYARVLIVELIPGFQSDGFQWCRTEYDGVVGYSQIDVKNWHNFQLD